MNDLSPYRAPPPVDASLGPRWYQLVARFRAWRAARAAARAIAEEARRDATRTVWVERRSGEIYVDLLGEGTPYPDGIYLSAKDLQKIVRHLRSGSEQACVQCGLYGRIVFVPSPWRERLAVKLEAIVAAGVK